MLDGQPCSCLRGAGVPCGQEGRRPARHAVGGRGQRHNFQVGGCWRWVLVWPAGATIFPAFRRGQRGSWRRRGAGEEHTAWGPVQPAVSICGTASWRPGDGSRLPTKQCTAQLCAARPALNRCCSERRGQSQKPEEIYQLIEELVPNGELRGPPALLVPSVLPPSCPAVTLPCARWAGSAPFRSIKRLLQARLLILNVTKRLVLGISSCIKVCLTQSNLGAGRYLEIFGRKNNLRDFWVTVGNEVTGQVGARAGAGRWHRLVSGCLCTNLGRAYCGGTRVLRGSFSWRFGLRASRCARCCRPALCRLRPSHGLLRRTACLDPTQRPLPECPPCRGHPSQTWRHCRPTSASRGRSTAREAEPNGGPSAAWSLGIRETWGLDAAFGCWILVQRGVWS